MKLSFLLFPLLVFSFFSLHAQAPQLMSYQAVIRNNNNVLVANSLVSMRISILKGSAAGAPVYVELHSVSTNSNGLAMITIGGGSAQNGTFAGISWANGPYFVKVETDPGGGSNYSIASTSQLLSVPYALYSEKSGTPGPQGPPGNGFQNGTAVGQMMFWNGTSWVTVAPGTTGQTLSFCYGVPTWGPCAGDPLLYTAGSVFCAYGPTILVNVMSPQSGKIWMDRNLGAAVAASSSTDVNSYGDLFQWGRRADGHQCRNSATTATISSTDQPGHANFIISPNAPNDWRSPQNDNLWQGVNGVNNPCPSSYRLPTAFELEEERMSWSSNNTAGAYASPLKLPLAGTRNGINGLISSLGSPGNYWSSTAFGTYDNYLSFGTGNAFIENFGYRAYGLSVRCIKD
ncbi:MAG: hypothetical protein ACOYOA_16620 [Saprospiraceae bacterium]